MIDMMDGSRWIGKFISKESQNRDDVLRPVILQIQELVPIYVT